MNKILTAIHEMRKDFRCPKRNATLKKFLEETIQREHLL